MFRRKSVRVASDMRAGTLPIECVELSRTALWVLNDVLAALVEPRALHWTATASPNRFRSGFRSLLGGAFGTEKDRRAHLSAGLKRGSSRRISLS
jgi:hypothetical protein